MNNLSADTYLESVIPPSGRVAGIDYGTVRVGLAITDLERTLASPWENYTRRNKALDALYFQKLFRDEGVTLLVVGLPLHMSGDESKKSGEARRFGKWLHEITALPVIFYDERYSTSYAQELLENAGMTNKQIKARRDKLAAYIILSSWLEHYRALLDRCDI